MTVEIPKNLPSEIQAKQNSCANCLHCRKEHRYNEQMWFCRAPANLSNLISQVTGEKIAHTEYCTSLRLVPGECIMQKPERIYYPNGNSVSIWQAEKEADSKWNSKQLSRTQVEDL